MAINSILTVTTPATNRLLTSLSTVKALFNINDDSKDAMLNVFIAMASSQVHNYCNRSFAQEPVSEVVRIWQDPWGRVTRSGVPEIQLQRFPVVAPAGAIVLTVTENATLLVQGTDYEIDYTRGILYRLLTNLDGTVSRTYWPYGEIDVAYTAGYVLPNAGSTRNLPNDLEDAVTRLIRRAYFASQRDPMTTSHSEPNLGSTSYWVGANGSGLLPDVCDILDNYREISLV